MSLASVMRAEAALLLPTYDRYKVLLRKGRGVYVYDDGGRAYLDLLAGIGVNALGHGHPAIRKALAQQADKLIHVSNLFYHDYQAELAKRLTRISGLDRAFFCNSGTEAWEAALKFARSYARTQSKNGSHPAWRFLALENSFHGPHLRIALHHGDGQVPRTLRAAGSRRALRALERRARP